MAGHRGDGVGDDDAIEVNLALFEESIVTPSPAIPKPPRTANKIHPNPPLKQTPHVRAKGTLTTISSPSKARVLLEVFHHPINCRRVSTEAISVAAQSGRSPHYAINWQESFFKRPPGLLANSGSRLAWGCLDGASTREGGSRQRFAEGSLVLVASECRVAGSQRCGGMYRCIFAGWVNGCYR